MDLESIIKSGTTHVSDEMLVLLESEISRVVKSFVTLSGAVKVRYKKRGENLVFMTEFEAENVRPLGFIPKRFL